MDVAIAALVYDCVPGNEQFGGAAGCRARYFSPLAAQAALSVKTFLQYDQNVPRANSQAEDCCDLIGAAGGAAITCASRLCAPNSRCFSFIAQFAVDPSMRSIAMDQITVFHRPSVLVCHLHGDRWSGVSHESRESRARQTITFGNLNTCGSQGSGGASETSQKRACARLHMNAPAWTQ